LETIFDKMRIAGEAGSLLRIEDEIKGLVEKARQTGKKLAVRTPELFGIEELNRTTRQPELSGLEKALAQLGTGTPLAVDFWDGIEALIYKALSVYAEQAQNGGAFQRRLFSEDAASGFAFIHLCRQRYDVALMNPPFGEAAVKSSDALKRYAVKNLYSCFVERVREITCPDGSFAAITDSTYLKQPTFLDLRVTLLKGEKRLHQIVDLGWGVLDANVRTALFVCHRANGLAAC
jgi:hypothetical protein